MTVEEFLMGYRGAMGRIDKLDADIQEAELRLRPAGNGFDKVRVRSGGSRRETEAKLADLVRQRSELLGQAEDTRREIMAFIDTVGDKSLEGDRQRRLLRLYYADGLTWGQIQKVLRPFRVRQDGTTTARKGGKGISETTLFRVRLEALGQAEVAWRRRG